MRSMQVSSMRIPALALATLLVMVTIAMPSSPSNSYGQQTQPRSYYKPCGSFRYKGKHDLFKHAYGCANAKRRSRYVLRKRKAPRGWKCSLGSRRKGATICASGAKAFLLKPAR